MTYQFIKLNKNYYNFLHTLRNDNYVRKQSLKNNNLIKLDEHLQWLKGIDHKMVFIIKFNNKNVGYIRLDKVNSFIYEISIAIIKSIRGNKESYTILEKFHKKIKKNLILIANIKKNNLASLKVFEKCGYIRMVSNKNYFEYCKIMNINKENIKILKIIDEIENVRQKNNINWMDILRVAINSNPKETIKIFKKISTSDNKILSLSKMIK